jgi:hypothetical protein
MSADHSKSQGDENSKTSSDARARDNHEDTDPLLGIGNAVRDFISRYNFTQKENNQHNKVIRRWTIAGAIGVFLYTVLTFVLLVGTVVHNCISNKFIRSQIAASQQANEISRQSFSAVQRAFITVTDVSVRRGSADRYPGGIPQNQFWMILPTIENSGNTPTVNLRWMNALSITTGPEQNPDVFAVDIEKRPSADPSPWNYGILGPKAKMTLDYGGNRVFLYEGTIAALAELDHWQSKMMCQGVIRYQDIFSDTSEHLTKFCYLVRADRSDGNDVTSGTGAPYLTQCGGHTNCADDECKANTARIEK